MTKRLHSWPYSEHLEALSVSERSIQPEKIGADLPLLNPFSFTLSFHISHPRTNLYSRALVRAKTHALFTDPGILSPRFAQENIWAKVGENGPLTASSPPSTSWYHWRKGYEWWVGVRKKVTTHEEIEFWVRSITQHEVNGWRETRQLTYLRMSGEWGEENNNVII